MKEKNNQKGFIQISLLVAIIISIVVVSTATTGVVLHKKGKLTPLVASVSQVFRATKDTEPEVKSEKSQSTEEQPQSEKINIEEISQTEQELEQARLEAEKTQAEAKRAQVEIEKAQLEAERLKAEQEAEKAKTKAEAEAERLKAEQEAQRIAEEQQRQEELQRQEEAQRIAEEKQKQKEQEISQRIESGVNYYSNQISMLEQDIDQIASAYSARIDKELSSYLNLTSSITAMPMFKPAIVERHKKMRENISNSEQFKPWLHCSQFQWSWDEQNITYEEYLHLLENVERSFKKNVDSIINSLPDLDPYLTEAKQLKQQINKFSYTLPVSSTEYNNNINNLISDLISLELKITNTIYYNFSIKDDVWTFSYPSPYSILSKEVGSLLTEEKGWFAKIKKEWGWMDDACWNLPTN